MAYSIHKRKMAILLDRDRTKSSVCSVRCNIFLTITSNNNLLLLLIYFIKLKTHLKNAFTHVHVVRYYNITM